MPETEGANHGKLGKPTDTETPTPHSHSHASADLRPPKFFAWLASLATAFTMLVNLLLDRGDNRYMRGAGAVVLAVAGILIFVPFVLLRKHGRGEDDETYMQTNAVVDGGLYALVRHPQYLGYMLPAAGFSLLSRQWLSVVLAGSGVACFYIQAVQEEEYCLRRLGEPYEEYLERVPAFNVVAGIVRLLRGQGVARN